ncbi:MAG: MFS transporter [Thermoleophilia bacterium]
MPRLLRNLTPDLRPLRTSRDFRLLELGQLVTGLGSQAALVALPFQVYILTGSAFLTGMIGLAELGPLVATSLVAGALADRHDRRRLLMACQAALVACAAALTAAAIHGDPPLWTLFALAGATAAASALERVCRGAIVPNTVDRSLLPAALSLSFGLAQLTMVVGPAVGGVLIAAFGVEIAYALDAVSCLGMLVAAWAMSPQPPIGVREREPVLRSIGNGLRFARRSDALIGSFVIDLAAMGFGMPRALFPVLAVSVFHAGASGAGILLASVSAGATVAALTTGWLGGARWLGRIVLVAVGVWGVAIAAAGLMTTLWPAALLFAVAGAADSVSAVCRTTITQSLTPDRMRGRMSSLFSLVVTSGPRLGDVESGSMAALTTPRLSVITGGLACVAAVVVLAVALPGLMAYDAAAVPVLDDPSSDAPPPATAPAEA